MCACARRESAASPPVFAVICRAQQQRSRTESRVQVADFYGVTIPFVAIILATEGLARGAGWAVGTCLLGSPVAGVYVAWKLTKGSIALRGADGYTYA